MISFMMNDVEYRRFDHLYAVSRCGKVLRNLLPYTPSRRGDGYLGIGRQRLMHRVVAACWLEDFDPKKQVHHKNEIKDDNRAENLECLTPKEHFGDRHDGNSGRYERTEITRQKLRDFRTGFKDTPEARAKKAAILDRVAPKTRCSYQGTVYPSVAAAGRALNIHPSTFRQRCNSKYFPDYQLL